MATHRSSHLEPAQLRLLRKRLQERELSARTAIRTEAARRAEQPYADLTGIVPDEGDAATADLLVDIDHALIGRQLEELDDIRAACERMRKRRYGVCIDCEQDIGFERLSAYPTAKRCTRCQNVHEHTHATAPRTTL